FAGLPPAERATTTGDHVATVATPGPTKLADAIPAAVADLERRQWVAQRLEALKGHPQAAADMRAGWPAGVPGFLGGHQHTPAELAAVIARLDAVEARYGLPLDPDPLHRGRAHRPPPDPSEGATLSAGHIADVVDAVGQLADA